MIDKTKNAFTLAEVLITLVIIGIVAVLTISNIINNTKKQEYVAGLKKANSVLSQAILKIGQNNCYAVGDYSFLKNINFIDEFSKVVSVTKKCNTIAECFDNDFYRLDNTLAVISDGKSVISSDGQMFSYTGLNLASDYGISEEDKNNVIGRVVVDINGKKLPNKYGYDIFFFLVVENKGIVPAGSYGTSDCNKSARGISCAAKVLRENAINY